jgi:hypothetical protein
MELTTPPQIDATIYVVAATALREEIESEVAEREQ